MIIGIYTHTYLYVPEVVTVSLPPALAATTMMLPRHHVPIPLQAASLVSRGEPVAALPCPLLLPLLLVDSKDINGRVNIWVSHYT